MNWKTKLSVNYLFLVVFAAATAAAIVFIHINLQFTVYIRVLVNDIEHQTESTIQKIYSICLHVEY